MAVRRKTRIEPGHGVSTPAQAHDTRIEQLTVERDQLLAELEAARQRIRDLEKSQDELLDRIDWTIDSLHSLLDSER